MTDFLVPKVSYPDGPPTDDQSLFYDDASDTWIPGDSSGGGGGGAVDTVAGVSPSSGDIPAAGLKTALSLGTASTHPSTDFQAAAADLTTIAALDSTTAGALVTDGSGWIRKTYAQLKTALSLAKGDVGLGNVDNTADSAKTFTESQITGLTSDLAAKEAVANKATDFTTLNNTLYPTTSAVNTAINAAVTGLLDYRGSYNASGNTFPSSGGSGLAGVINKADFWVCSVAGTLGGTAVKAGDLIIALVDLPGSTAANWDLVNNDLGFAPAPASRQVSTGTGLSGGGDLTADRTLSLAVISAATILGNNGGSSAAPSALTVAQVKTLLALAVADISGAAPLASPTLTGDPKAPTPTGGDNDVSIATTAFVHGEIATQHTADNAAYAPIGTGTPSGPAGGGLSGTYPNPDVAAGEIVDSMVNASAAISPSKIALVNDGAFATSSQRTQAYSVLARRKVNRFYLPPGVMRVNSTLATVAGLMYLMPILAERPITIDAFNIFWSTAPTAGQIRFGLYADDGEGVPTGAALADTGLATANTTSATSQTKTLGTPYAASPGRYWIGFLACSNLTGSPAVAPFSPASDAYGAVLPGSLPYVYPLTTTLPTIATISEIGSELWPAVSFRDSAYQ